MFRILCVYLFVFTPYFYTFIMFLWVRNKLLVLFHSPCKLHNVHWDGSATSFKYQKKNLVASYKISILWSLNGNEQEVAQEQDGSIVYITS